jgi:hypothetical protein
VKISLSDFKYVQNANGYGGRATINISQQHPELGELMLTVRGCLIFRDKFDRIAVMTPIVWLGGRGGRKVKYRPMVLSPGLHEWLANAIEKKWGEHIRRNPETLSGTHPSRIDPSLDDTYTEVIHG